MTFYDATAADFSQPVSRPLAGCVRMGLMKPGTWGLYERGVPAPQFREGGPFPPSAWRIAGERTAGGARVLDLLHRHRADADRTTQIVRAHRARASDQALALDCEFDAFGRGVSDDERLARLQSVANAARAAALAAPGALITAYDEVGHQHVAARPGEADRVRSMHAIARSAGLNARVIPGFVPSVTLYTLSDDEAAWERATRVKIDAAREAGGERIIAWVWAHYHSGVFVPVHLRGRPLPLDVWERQLRLLASMDGVDIAIWSERPSENCRQEPWVQVTERVITEVRRSVD